MLCIYIYVVGYRLLYVKERNHEGGPICLCLSLSFPPISLGESGCVELKERRTWESLSLCLFLSLSLSHSLSLALSLQLVWVKVDA